MHGPPSKPRSRPPYVEPLAEQAPDRLVVATKVVGSVVPPLPSTAGNSEEGQAVAEVAISKVVSNRRSGPPQTATTS
jgi:hypothetical protein